MIKLRGTFLDEITHDIPAHNWGFEEWDADFANMKAVGIDTVILIRAGYRQYATFASKVLQKEMNMFPVYEDQVQQFLDLSEKHGMRFFFGLYDSGKYWINKDYKQEIRINKDFCDEVVQRYGAHPAFQGWYFSHEIGKYESGVMDVYREMASHLKKLKPMPILISPYVHGVKQFVVDKISFDDHVSQWRKIFTEIGDVIDFVAFQDGQVAYEELKDYLQAHKGLADEFGIESWSNVESFDRDMPWKFPPLRFRDLRMKMEMAASAGVENLITFEFSHFMSPQSIYPGAHGLYKKYKAWIDEQKSQADC